MLLGSSRSFRLSRCSQARTRLASPPVRKENLALHDSKEQWFIGSMTFWLGFIGNMDLLARVHRVDLLVRFIGNMDLLARVHRVDLLARFIGNMDLLARVHRVDLLARFIGNMDLLASRLISYAFKGQMNDLCRKVKWSERPEPRASNVPGLGAWTRPPDRRWRITARGTWLAFRVLAAGAGKTFNTGQSASKRGLTRGGKPSAPDHESP